MKLLSSIIFISYIRNENKTSPGNLKTALKYFTTKGPSAFLLPCHTRDHWNHVCSYFLQLQFSSAFPISFPFSPRHLSLSLPVIKTFYLFPYFNFYRPNINLMIWHYNFFLLIFLSAIFCLLPTYKKCQIPKLYL